MNPDMSFAGVMPLHLACELGHVDLVAYLLHWCDPLSSSQPECTL